MVSVRLNMIHLTDIRGYHILIQVPFSSQGELRLATGLRWRFTVTIKAFCDVLHCVLLSWYAVSGGIQLDLEI